MAGPTPIRRLAINTGGGDAPGLNAVIQAATIAAVARGWEVWGVHEGYAGLLEPERFADGGLVRLTSDAVRDIAHLGGTILGTVNRGNPFKVAEGLPGGMVVERDRTDDVMAAFRARELDALVAIGGDGTLTIAEHLSRHGLRVVGVPKTIDNDLAGTQVTFGYHSAVSFATDCIDRLHSTADAHRRIIVVEVMGRYAGWIALNAGLAGRADAILIPELPYRLEHVAQHLARQARPYSIIVVAEGARPVQGGVAVVAREVGSQERLGGAGERVAAELGERMGRDARAVVLGHLLRGGSPVAFDRILGLTFGAAAVDALARGRDGVMVALRTPHLDLVPLAAVAGHTRTVPLDGEGVVAARALDRCLGDCA